MPVLRFLEREDLFSTYLDRNGEEVYLSHGYPPRRLVEFDWGWFHEQWDDWPGTSDRDRRRFLEYLESLLINPEALEDVVWCKSCPNLGSIDDWTMVQGDDYVCDECLADYYHRCTDCAEWDNDVRWAVGNHPVCEYCCDRRWSYCDECEGYYRDDDASQHRHNGCDCESPARRFTVRNDGEPPLANDTRVTVTLPAGIIDAEGLTRIYQHVYFNVKPDPDTVSAYEVAQLIHQLGDKWQTREGNFTKRLSRLVYNTHKVSISPEVLSQVGCIAREHSRQVDFAIEVTRNLNLSAEDFGHEDSCWWGGYYRSRCALKSHGGFGLRTFTGDYNEVSGRAWVMPLKHGQWGLEPTFDTESPAAFVVFNGYGDLSGYNACRIVSHMAGWTYRKIGFSCSPMYVNSGGYLIAPEEIASQYTDGSLSFDLEDHANLHARETETNQELSHVA